MYVCIINFLLLSGLFLFFFNAFPNGPSPVNGQRIRRPRSNMNKESIKNIYVVAIMILRYILCSNVSKLIQ